MASTGPDSGAGASSTVVAPVARKAADPIPPVVKRNTLLFAGSQAFVGIGMQMVPTLGAIMVVQLLGSPALAGIGTSILGVSRFLVAYPVGKITDAYGRKLGLVLGLVLSLVGALLSGFSMVQHSFPMFLAGMLIFGLGVNAGHQLRVAAADMYPPSRRATGLGYVLTGSLLGAIIAPLFVSTAQTSSRSLGMDPLALAWIMVPGVILPSIALVLLVRPDPKEIAAHLERYYPGYKPPTATGAGDTRGGFITFVRHYPKQVAFISSFAVQGTMAMMMAMTALVLHHHGHPLTAVSLAVAIHVVGMFGFSLPFGSLADRLGRRPIMLLGILLAGGGALLVPLTPYYWVIVAGIFLVGLGWSCINVAATALIADTTGAAQRGRAIGTNDTFSAASAVVMPLLGGVIADRVGLLSLGFVGMALMVPPLFLLLRLHEASPGKYRETAS